ncbi:hypothetical protein JCM8097_003926 [Rhodosporidiobolus ruineniae]
MAPSPATPPSGFPSTVQYLTTPSPSRLLPSQHKTTYCSPCPPHLLPNPPPKVAIKKISDPRHPANGQSGLFALTALPRGTWIRDYCGVVHTEKEADLESDYDLSLERNWVDGAEGEEGRWEVVGCDATKAGSEARFVNDYRGVPNYQRPNAVFELRSFPLTHLPPDPATSQPRQGVRMSVWAGPHGVEKGAELCVSYGRGFWEKRREEWAEKERKEAETAATTTGRGESAKGREKAEGKKGKEKGGKGKKG